MKTKYKSEAYIEVSKKHQANQLFSALAGVKYKLTLGPNFFAAQLLDSVLDLVILCPF